MRAAIFLITVLILFAPCVQAQSFERVEIMEVASDLRYTDGPSWSPAGYLFFSDVPNQLIARLLSNRRPAVFRENSGGANGMFFDKSGALYVCETARRQVTRSETGGTVSVVASEWQGKPLNSPNDITGRKRGDLFFTDPAFGSDRENQQLDFHGLFHVDKKGVLSLVKKFQNRINGLAFAPDDKTLYVTDVDSRSILALEIDGRGKLRSERVFVEKLGSIPGGLCTDKKRHVYVAAGEILVFDKSGVQVAQLNVPETPSNCAFGGNDRKSLYVTAGPSVYMLNTPFEGHLPY
jgi:gluconolactonase